MAKRTISPIFNLQSLGFFIFGCNCLKIRGAFSNVTLTGAILIVRLIEWLRLFVKSSKTSIQWCDPVSVKYLSSLVFKERLYLSRTD